MLCLSDQKLVFSFSGRLDPFRSAEALFGTRDKCRTRYPSDRLIAFLAGSSEEKWSVHAGLVFSLSKGLSTRAESQYDSKASEDNVINLDYVEPRVFKHFC